jgi:hypothetical protein
VVAAPLAIILGWGNATHRQLEPYRRLWRRLGAEPRTYVANPLLGSFAPSAQIRKIRRETRAIVRASAEGRRDIWVHALSDNGFITWGVMLEELAALPEGVRTREAVRGVVFDSTPGLHQGRRRHEFAYRMARGMTPGLLHVLGREVRPEHPLITPALELGFGALYMFRDGFGRRGGFAVEIAHLYERVLRWEPDAPQLYFYGDLDRIVTPYAVEEHIGRERARGIRARGVLIHDAPHVGCWVTAPDVYEEEVAALVAGKS